MLCKIEQDDLIIQQIVNKFHSLASAGKLWLCSTLKDFKKVLPTYLYRRDICYVWMVDNKHILTIYGLLANLLNKKLCM